MYRIVTWSGSPREIRKVSHIIQYHILREVILLYSFQLVNSFFSDLDEPDPRHREAAAAGEREPLLRVGRVPPPRQAHGPRQPRPLPPALHHGAALRQAQAGE